jgi:hypothetical protein
MKFDMGKVYMLIFIAIIPLTIVYFILSKYIIKGVTLGCSVTVEELTGIHIHGIYGISGLK